MTPTIEQLAQGLRRRWLMAVAMGCSPQTVEQFRTAMYAVFGIESEIFTAKRSRAGGAS